MRRYSFFNAQRPSVEDMNYLGEYAIEDIREIIGIHLTAGIMRASEEQIIGELKRKIQFPSFTINADPTKLDINLASGLYAIICISGEGYPCIIRSNEAYTASPTDFQNSGNQGITFPGDGTYYIWVDYKELKNPSISRTNKYAVAFNPAKLNGYEIIIETTPAPAPPSGHPYAVYLGSLIVTGGNVGSFDQATNIVFSGIKPQNVTVEIDESNKTTVYSDGDRLQLDKHINAIGESLVAPDNPHGTHPNDIKTIDNEKFSQLPGSFTTNIGVFRNGILSGSEQIQSLGTLYSIPAIHNVTSDWYVYFDGSTPSTLQAVYDGRIYNLVDSHVKDIGDNLVKVYFDVGDAEGWYKIFLSKASAADEFLTLGKELTGVVAFPTEAETKIILGYVFWKNNEETTRLQKNEQKTASTGEGIYPIKSLGFLNKEKGSFEVRNVNYTGIVNKNIFPNSGFKYGAPIVDGKINGVMTITGASWQIAADSNYSFNKVLKLWNITSGAKITITPPPNINLDAQNATFTFGFRYAIDLPNGGYMVVTPLGGLTGALYPPIQNADRQDFMTNYADSGTSLDNIEIEFFNTTADASNIVYLDAFQWYKLKVYQRQPLDDFSTGEVFHDSQIATSEKRSEIKDQPLNIALLNSIINGSIINYDDVAEFTGNTLISQNPENMEIFFIRGRCNYSAGTGTWNAEWDFDNTKYKILGASFNWFGDHADTHSGFRPGWFEISASGPLGGQIVIKVPRYAYGSVPTDRPFVWGTVFAERIA